MHLKNDPCIFSSVILLILCDGRFLVEQGCIPPLCDLLTVMDVKIVQVALNGLENILRLGQQDAKLSGGPNQYAVLIEECFGKTADWHHTWHNDVAVFHWSLFDLSQLVAWDNWTQIMRYLRGKTSCTKRSKYGTADVGAGVGDDSLWKDIYNDLHCIISSADKSQSEISWYLTLNMLNCFKDNKRCIHILYHIWDFILQKKTIHNGANLHVASPILSIPFLMMPWRLKEPGNLGAVSIRKTVLPGMAIPMLKIRRPNGRLKHGNRHT